MKLKLLKAARLKDLFDSVPENLELYRSGDFAFLESDPAGFIELEHDVDSSALAAIACDVDDHNEVKNCVAMWEALKDLSPYLARDDRLWTFLSHTSLFAYAQQRWPIPKDDEAAAKHIRNHFFVIGARGVERDNAASRLWWMASLCHRAQGLSLEQAATCLLYKTDVRASIIERPTTSQSTHVFSAILRKLQKSYEDDKSLFERTKFRPAMRKLNLVGGTKLLAALGPKDVDRIVDSCF